MMTKIQKMKQDVKRVAGENGHNLSRFQKNSNQDWYADCKTCNKVAFLIPLKNHLVVAGGTAIIQKCDRAVQ